MQQLSPGVKAFAIIFIILAALAIIGIVLLFLMAPPSIIANALLLILSICWLISGIGILGAKNWARIMATTLAVVEILLTVGLLVIILFNAALLATFLTFLGAVTLIVPIVIVIVRLAYYVCILVFFNRAAVVDQFRVIITTPPPPVSKEPYRAGPRTGPQAEAKMAMVILKHGSRAPEHFVLDGYETKIGRGEENQICIPDSTLTHEHAKLFLDQGKWILQDMGSLNGTFLNGKKVLKHALLDNDKIQVGNATLIFKMS